MIISGDNEFSSKSTDAQDQISSFLSIDVGRRLDKSALRHFEVDECQIKCEEKKSEFFYNKISISCALSDHNREHLTVVSLH